MAFSVNVRFEVTVSSHCKAFPHSGFSIFLSAVVFPFL